MEAHFINWFKNNNAIKSKETRVLLASGLLQYRRRIIKEKSKPALIL